MTKQFAEVAMFVDDVPAMQAFYEKLLGVAPTYHNESIAIFNLNGVQILIHAKYEPQAGELPPENHTAYKVENVDAAASELQAQGLILEREPADYDWGRSAYLRDPAGNLIELTGN